MSNNTEENIQIFDSEITDDAVVFYKPSSPFSAWYISKFYIDGQPFNTVEQYMSYEKARYFGDTEIANKVLQSNDPKEQKYLGRKVKLKSDEDKQRWQRICEWIAYDANLAKFSQNHRLKKTIQKTGNLRMIYASSFDEIWGNGLEPETNNGSLNEENLDSNNWKGVNLMGSVLEAVRNDINNGWDNFINNKDN